MQVTNPSRNIKAVFGARTSDASGQFMLCASSAFWFYGFRYQQVTTSDLDDNLHIYELSRDGGKIDDVTVATFVTPTTFMTVQNLYIYMWCFLGWYNNKYSYMPCKSI